MAKRRLPHRVAPDENVDVYAIGFVFGSNEDVGGEFWRAIGEDEMLIQSSAGVGTGNNHSLFLGYVSTVPLTGVEYDEDEGGDDVFVKNLYFGYRERP